MNNVIKSDFFASFFYIFVFMILKYLNMNKISYIIFFLIFQLQGISQNTTIEYWKNTDSHFIITQTRYTNNKLIDSKKLALKKDGNIFKYKGLNINYLPQVKPKYNKDIQADIDKNINRKNMPNINYTTILCLIISAEGKIINIGIIKGEGFPYDYEVIKAVKMLKIWSPAQNNNKPVNSLLYIDYKYVIK